MKMRLLLDSSSYVFNDLLALISIKQFYFCFLYHLGYKIVFLLLNSCYNFFLLSWSVILIMCIFGLLFMVLAFIYYVLFSSITNLYGLCCGFILPISFWLMTKGEDMHKLKRSCEFTSSISWMIYIVTLLQYWKLICIIVIMKLLSDCQLKIICVVKFMNTLIKCCSECCSECVFFKAVTFYKT